MNREEEDQFRRSVGRWRFVAVVFILISLVLSIFLIALAVFAHRKPKPIRFKFCGDVDDEKIDVTEASDPGVFHDLTMKELEAVQKYLYSQKELNLCHPTEADPGDSYIYTVDLYLPKKNHVLRFLDGKRSQPDREALVVVFRGDKSPPGVEEYIVGALPDPSYMLFRDDPNRPNPIRFNSRPDGMIEFGYIYQQIFPGISSKLKTLLEESYGTSRVYPRCVKGCLAFFRSPVGSGALGSHDRKMWLVMTHFVEFFSLHPIGLSFLLKHNVTKPSEYDIEAIIYNGQTFHSIEELASRYRAGHVSKHKVPPPSKDKDLYSTMKLRGKPLPEVPKRPPKLFEPDGKRYKISNRHVEYMQWSFDFRMSAIAGPQIYDIRFNDERLAYEVGLQEIAVLYSGQNPAHMTSDYLDSTALLGIHSLGLVPEIDCPDTSTFIDGSFIVETSATPSRFVNIFCVYEENSGIPLRRHAGYHEYLGHFHSGMTDNSLVLRTILTIGNYDYIFDFVFHQNGALQMRSAMTGYLFSSFHKPEEREYGFRLHDTIVGNIHHHLFNYKIDLDIHGLENRYETLDISETEVDNDYSVNNATYWQTKFRRTLKESEAEAAYNFNFEHPKYHIFHNDGVKTTYGEISGYRLHLDGMSYRPTPDNVGNEGTLTWSRYQMAVTKHKEVERSSSSCYGMFDSLDPVVNFTSFLADNENLKDEDLVVWATVGLHHIPHTEDLPVTPTTGGHLGIYLLPYNYFKECPSMSSRDAIRIEPKDSSNKAAGIRVERYGNSGNGSCVPRSNNIEDMIEEIGQLFS